MLIHEKTLKIFSGLYSNQMQNVANKRLNNKILEKWEKVKER